jgi:uncharacterized repeat protein (TIGR03803 family)
MPIHLVRLAAVLVTLTAAQGRAQTFQTVHNFPADGSEGTKPMATLTIGPDRSLYGTTTEGGTEGSGTAFKLTTAGAFANLGSFQAAATGKVSRARLVNIGDGFLYGATSLGTGTAGQPIGTVFKLDPAGGLTPIFPLPGGGTDSKIPMSLTSGESNVLHVLGSSPGGIWRVPLAGGVPTPVFNFPASGDSGLFPWRILRASDGNLYGVTTGTSFVDNTPGRQGTIFRIASNGTGFTTLHDCDLATGVAPIGGMVEGPDGTLYGTMSAGGTNSDGVIFKLSPQGQYSVLYSINDQAPSGDLLLATDGKLYGTSARGGTKLYGSIFRLNTNGTGFQVIHTFTKANGAYPDGGLVQADDGNLYGVTTEGGPNDQGTIFRIDLNLPVPQVNRPPIATNDQGFSSGSAVGVNVLANDFDPDDDALEVTVQTQPSHGTATVDFGGQILYSPTPGQYNGHDEFTYRITDPDGLFAEATVVISDQAIPSPWQPGVYNGILNLDPNLSGDDDTPRGQLVINVNATGIFTGKLFTQGLRLTVRGFFDEGGTAIAAVKIPRKGTAILFLAAGEGNSLSVVMFGQELWTGFVLPFQPPNPPAKASYTLVLPNSDPNLPVGSGYGTVRLLSNGLVAVVGKLADGSRIAWGTTLVSSGGTTAIPVFSNPLRGGAVGGFFVATGASPTFQASLRWIRPRAAKSTLPYPNGFSGPVSGAMDLYTPPPRGVLPVDFGTDQLGAVALGGPTINPSVGGTLTVQGTRLLSSGQLRSFAINRATGLFTGKMKVGTRTVVFGGAVLQSLKTGSGFCTYEKTSGLAVFQAD